MPPEVHTQCLFSCLLLVFDARSRVQAWRVFWWMWKHPVSRHTFEKHRYTQAICWGLNRLRCVLCYLRLPMSPSQNAWSPSQLKTAGPGCSWLPPLQQQGCCCWCCWLWWVFTITDTITETEAQQTAAAAVLRGHLLSGIWVAGVDQWG